MQTEEHPEGKIIVKLEGELVIAKAAEMKKALTSSIKRYDSIEIIMEEATRIDLSVMQLLYSAQQTAASKDKEFIVTDASGFYQDACITAGFI